MDSEVEQTAATYMSHGPHEGKYRVTLHGSVYLTLPELAAWDQVGRLEVVIPDPAEGEPAPWERPDSTRPQTDEGELIGMAHDGPFLYVLPMGDRQIPGQHPGPGLHDLRHGSYDVPGGPSLDDVE